MNIIILPTAFPNTYNKGSAIFVQDQAEALSKLGINVKVVGAIPISFKDIFRKKLCQFTSIKYSKQGVVVHLFLFPSLPKMKVFNNFFRNIINKYLLNKYCKEQNIDAIYVHNSTAGSAAVSMRKKFKIPYVIIEHSSAYARGLMSHGEINKYRNIYNNASHRIAVSKEFCNVLGSLFCNEFTYIPNLVDVKCFKIKESKKTSDEFIFINIAYLNPNKNHKLLIKSFCKAFKNDNIKLHILGGGAEFNDLQNLISELKVENRVILFNTVSRKKVIEELQKADVFVLSSKYETFGVVLIEAMACGLPIIATKCGGPESIIDDESLGLLVENESIDAFSNAMESIYVNFKKYNSKEIRNHAIQNFSETVVAGKIKDILEQVKNE